MKFHYFAAISAALMLCACQSKQPTSAVTVKTAPRLPPVAQQQALLWQEGVLQASASLPVTVIRSDSDRVTLSWNGDAVELLMALARARGQTFSYVGVRLPLPVDIDVQGITYSNLLRIIEMQTAWRATLVTYPGQMVLQFMASIPAQPPYHLKRGKR